MLSKKSIGFHKAYRSQLYLFFSFKTLIPYSSQDISKFILRMDGFSVYIVSIIYFHEVIDFLKQLSLVKTEPSINTDPSHSEAN